MKKLNYLFGIAAIAGAMFMTSCGQDDNPVTGAPQEEALFTYDFAAAAAAEEFMVGKASQRPTASVRTTKATHGKRVAYSQRSATYGVVATELMVIL